MKKVISVMIAVLMVIALLPLNAFALPVDPDALKEIQARADLGQSIGDAEAEIEKAKISTDGKDVDPSEKWVKQTDVDTLKAAVVTANVIFNDKEKSADELISAKKTLDDAIKAFNDAKNPGTKPADPEPKPGSPDEKDALRATINRAEQAIRENPSAPGKDKLQQLINEAQALVQSKDASSEKLKSVQTFLATEIGMFLMNSNSGTKPEVKPQPKPQPKPDTKPSDNDYPYYRRGYRYGYYRPASLEYTMDKAKTFKNNYSTQIANASYAARTEFNSAYSDVLDMYNNEYWGYYGYYDGYYYGDRVYYRNGNWYNYDEYVRRYGTYDMESYRRYGYYDGYYYGDLYERNGKLYSYSEYRNIFGRYPYESERVRYRDGYGYWDPYYGWTYDGKYYNGYYDYYGSNYRARLERLIDAIRAIAREYPTNSSIYINYSGLAYPSYSSDYYYGYDYYGYNGLTSSQVKNMRELISKAENLRGQVKGNVDKQIVNNLQAAIDDGYRALQGRSSYSTAYSNLEAAINSADLVDNTIYIRNAYMQGIANGNFGPNEQLTRAQVAQIVANLLRQSGKTTVYNPKQYKDVEDYRWYKGAVDLVTSYGIMEGTPAGNFEPNRLVTKAELVVTAARLKNYQTTPGNVFGLTSHYWAQGYIQTAYVNGWLDTKNGFVPNAPITRGETVHIFNGALGYGPDQDYIIKYANQMNKFNDVTRGMDYYFDIITATNSISYKVKLNGNRVWLTHMQPNGIWAMPQYSAGGVAVNPLN